MGTHRRRRAAAIAISALLALATACSSTATTTDQAADTAAADTGSTTSAPASTIPVESGLETAVLQETYVDSTRTTPAANGKTAELPSRTIETTIIHPTNGTEPYPVVVLSHGLAGLSSELVGFGTTLASHGYVVLLPRFPNSARDAPGGPSVADLVNQPGDVRFVLDRFLADPPADLAGSFDPKAIGAVGHSLGGATTLGVGAHPKERDPRVKAIVVLSGVNIGFEGGDLFSGDSAPVLFMQGDDDRTLDPGTRSAELYEQAPPPKYRITIVGGSHSGPYEGATARPQVTFTATATADFLDQYLKGSPDGVKEMTALVDGSDGLGKLESDPG